MTSWIDIVNLTTVTPRHPLNILYYHIKNTRRRLNYLTGNRLFDGTLSFLIILKFLSHAILCTNKLFLDHVRDLSARIAAYRVWFATTTELAYSYTLV